MTETISGIIAAILIIILTRLLSKHFTLKLITATILVAIAFIYVGFVLKDNPVSTIVFEISVSMAFYFAALIGYTKKNAIIAWGIIGHGIWDILHHNGLFVQTNIPVYWPSFCFVIDIITGPYFLLLFKQERQRRNTVGVLGTF